MNLALRRRPHAAAGLIHKVAYAYCRNATDRDDVIQEITIQLWRSRHRYDARFKET
jgi:RNA polymerase sigma-70 factor (ECF subfamily)